MVEFALVLFPLILFVGGVIQLGIGIANWHDIDRVANEGARYAAVNEWPDCPASQTTCAGNPACNALPAAQLGRSLTNFLSCEGRHAGAQVVICSPTGTAAIGDPVTVKLTTRFSFLTLNQSDLKKVTKLGVSLRGEATMRVERQSTKYTTTAC